MGRGRFRLISPDRKRPGVHLIDDGAGRVGVDEGMRGVGLSAAECDAFSAGIDAPSSGGATARSMRAGAICTGIGPRLSDSSLLRRDSSIIRCARKVNLRS